MTLRSSPRGLLLACALLAAPVSAQLFVYLPPSACTQCTVPYNLGLPECETPLLSQCYCQNFTLRTLLGEGMSGTYITPILSCARSTCKAWEVDDLIDYYGELCSPPASLQAGKGKAVEISTLLTSTEVPSPPAEERKLSRSCSYCLTLFTANTFNRCTPSDLSACLCSSNTPDQDMDQFVLDCPCSAPAQRAASLGNDAEMLAHPAMQLLGCLRGPSCSGADKALLARWGEGRCGDPLFMGEKTYKGEWGKDEAREGRLTLQGLKKRMSSWGADDGFVKIAGVGRTARTGEWWAVGVVVVGLALGGIL